MSDKSKRCAIAAVIALCVVGTTLAASRAQQPALTSQEAFFSPDVRAGEMLTWRTRETDYAGRQSGYEFQCKVVSVNKASYIVESYPYSINPGWGTYVALRFSLRQGVVSALKGKSTSGFLCGFLLTRLYGEPPAILRPGASWRFANPTTGLWSNARGTVTVTSLDPVRRSVRLRVAYTRAGMVDEARAANGHGWEHFQVYRNDRGTIDATVARGGIVVDQVLQLAGKRGGSHTVLVP